MVRIASHIIHYLFKPSDSSIPDLTVVNFSGYEAISQLTHFEINLLGPTQSIDFEKLLNKPASLVIRCWPDFTFQRMYHGIICSFEQTGQTREVVSYRAELVPRLWRLTLNHQSRIFQDKSVPDIIREVLTDGGLTDFRFSLQGAYEPLNKPPREFCVQYRESDFNFISRLMEEEGIFYFFEYNNEKEIMVIADSPSVHKEAIPRSDALYEEPTGLPPLEEEIVFPLQYKESVLPSKVTLKDFNYDTPQMNLLASSQINPITPMEFSDYPGRFGFMARGSHLARVRNEEIIASKKIISGKSSCRSFCTGYRFTLKGHPRGDFNRQYLLTKISHYGVQGGPLAQDIPTRYENQFECIPSDVTYRPPRVTLKPKVQGTQTAIVVGPSGEKLYMDEKGRAKVQFHWDLEGKKNEKSSCWVRVSHGYAGQKHGIQFHPLVGDEVIVDFLEGDPDKPIIVGRVYNGDNRPPLKPENRIQNIILTPYQHRLLFDDRGAYIILNTGGGEVLFMADGKESSDYGNNIKITTADKHYIHLAKGEKLKGVELKTEAGHWALFKDEPEPCIYMEDKDKNLSLRFDSDNKSIHINNASDQVITVTCESGKIRVSAKEIEIHGNQSVKVDAGQSIEISAPQIKVEGGVQTEVKGGAMVIIQGGLVKIN
jgi:type VI secretion system VgrG family protein